jgi:hypothetical protein
LKNTSLVLAFILLLSAACFAETTIIVEVNGVPVGDPIVLTADTDTVIVKKIVSDTTETTINP